ncbi:MAG: UpxY family transcription antiterminator [Thermodesulfovibrionales bacterium]|nr:UpxY family transcription antiterminator [Thermodesulfovibrionales bacterium]
MKTFIIDATTDNTFPKWYAIHVKSRHEFKVMERLTNTGIEAFLPAVDRLSRWKDRKKLLSFPLFPGYLFVHIDKIYKEMLSVLKTPGVVRFLGMIPAEPEPVPDEQIISLKKLIDSKEDIDPYPYLKEGQRIRIKKGPLAGVEGMFLKRPGQHILIVSVDILRQGVSVKIDASDVESA